MTPTTNTRKYYVKVPAGFCYSGQPCWAELHDVKTLTTAQYFVDRKRGAPNEIGVSVNGSMVTLVSQKNAQGKWELVHKNSGSQS